MSKGLKRFGKLFLVLVIILSTVRFINDRDIHAAEAKTVRVSTAKQLKKAMKNPDVGTIILRTQAYTDITIKAEKAATDKFLIVDSINANVINKAVFAGITIKSANSYTESVSGNKISVEGYLDDQTGFVVSGKKQVESLTMVYSMNYYPGYVLKKGAKIKELVLIVIDNGAPVELTLNTKNKTAKYKLTDEFGYYEDYKITIDKNGRLSHAVCDSDCVEFAYDYTYKYDSDSNLICISGRNNDKGDFTDTFTYSGGKLVKRVLDDWDFMQIDREYDSKGNLVYEQVFVEYHMDGSSSTDTNYYKYEYDANNRLTYERMDNIDGNYFEEYSYTYDTKGFRIEKYSNDYGLEIYETFTYNKSGDMITVKKLVDGETFTTKHKYDKLGNPKD